jgi:ribonucleoside-diphosphate reductase alpha chain
MTHQMLYLKLLHVAQELVPRDSKYYYRGTVYRGVDVTRSSTLQKWVDSSISKTNNFPANATVEDMRESYLLAYKLGCKDVTVFRDTSIQGQVLVSPGKKKEAKNEQHNPGNDQPLRAPQLLTVPLVGASRSGTEQIKLCPQCTTSVVYQEGCYICPECGWGACS